jgi:DNA-binding response OmpR family regulator
MARQHGADNVIAKPFRAEDRLNRVRALTTSFTAVAEDITADAALPARIDSGG